MDVIDELGRAFNDYYSASTGLKTKSQVCDNEGKVTKEITYEYGTFNKYKMPSSITETSKGLRIDIQLSDYDFSTQLKKQDFTIILDTGKMKKNKR